MMENNKKVTGEVVNYLMALFIVLVFNQIYGKDWYRSKKRVIIYMLTCLAAGALKELYRISLKQ